MFEEKIFFKIGWLVVWSIILSIYLFPFIWMIMTGIRDPIESYNWPPKFIFIPKFNAFKELFLIRGILRYLKNSLIISSFATFLTIIISTFASYALVHLKVKGKSALLFSLLFGRVIPPVALVVPVFLLASKLRMLDKYLTMIVIYTVFNIPFAIWLIRSFFNDVPNSIREAALVDGASEIGVFFKILLPLAIGGIMTTAVFIFIACWNEFMFALALTRHNASTLPVMVMQFRTQYGIEWANMGATSLIITTPVIIFSVLMHKYLIRGLTMGSVRE